MAMHKTDLYPRDWLWLHGPTEYPKGNSDYLLATKTDFGSLSRNMVDLQSLLLFHIEAGKKKKRILR